MENEKQKLVDEFIRWHTSETTFALGTPDDKTISEWWLEKLDLAITERDKYWKEICDKERDKI